MSQIVQNNLCKQNFIRNNKSRYSINTSIDKNRSKTAFSEQNPKKKLSLLSSIEQSLSSSQKARADRNLRGYGLLAVDMPSLIRKNFKCSKEMLRAVSSDFQKPPQQDSLLKYKNLSLFYNKKKHKLELKEFLRKRKFKRENIIYRTMITSMKNNNKNSNMEQEKPLVKEEEKTKLLEFDYLEQLSAQKRNRNKTVDFRDCRERARTSLVYDFPKLNKSLDDAVKFFYFRVKFHYKKIFKRD